MLVGAELEENLGLRYMAAALEQAGHQAEIVPFNTANESSQVVQQVLRFQPQVVGLSMVFTGRADEFCRLAQAIRSAGSSSHIIAGGHFASFNRDRLLQDFPAFDSIALCEGEEIICSLAASLPDLSQVPGLCYRLPDGKTTTNPTAGNPENLDQLPFPKRSKFHSYFDRRIASILTSRGCWRDCAFCSINAWYKQSGGKKFRYRSVENIVAEMKELYHTHQVRIFNFQDDNFFLPDPQKAARRFGQIRDRLKEEGVENIAIAVKARPDSITRESISILDELGLFRVFLGVENASARGLENLNRICTFEQILNALQILNDYDVHIAYNLLMFEPDTILDDILINLRFIERHIENPFNFCRAEVYAGTGLERKLRAEGRLLGDYFGFDYRLKDPRSEAFHQIANYAFFDRNFSDYGLHYFNMQVDFYFQLLKRFYPEKLTQRMRGAVRNFIKHTNLDTFECLCEIYDFVVQADPTDLLSIRTYSREMRAEVDSRSAGLRQQGERILDWLTGAVEACEEIAPAFVPGVRKVDGSGSGSLSRSTGWSIQPERRSFGSQSARQNAWDDPVSNLLGILTTPIPYEEFKRRLAEEED
jgi:methylmalonyl-CoA mutase cobalamin-binding subunit